MAQAAPEEPAQPSEARAKDHRIDDSVAAFYALLPEVLGRELDVQRYERRTLGAEELEKLSGHRHRRRLRIDDDAANFLTRASQFSVRPLPLPGSADIVAAADAGRRLGATELAMLSAIGQVYAAIARPRRLEAMHDSNTRFLTEGNWATRDDAVRQRDAIIDDLRAFQFTSSEAWRIVKEYIGKQALDQLQADLGELAPSVDLGSGSLSKLVLEDETTRNQVLAEMRTTLAPQGTGAGEAPDDAALLEAREIARSAIAKQTGVLELLVEDGELSGELEAIEKQLEDQGVNLLEPDERAVVLKRRTEILRRRAALRGEWRHTPVPEPYLSSFLDAVEAQLEARIWDLGSHGALFAHRLDAARTKRAELNPEIAPLVWDFMAEFVELTEAVAAAKPPPDPLAGMSLGNVIVLDPALRKQQAQILKLLQQAQAAAAKADAKKGAKGPLPKPKPKGR